MRRAVRSPAATFRDRPSPLVASRSKAVAAVRNMRPDRITTKEPEMNASFLHSVPPWVFVVFALLLVFGLRESFPRTMSLRRSTLLPIALLTLSLLGVASSFGAVPLALPAWAAGVAAAAAVARHRRDLSAVHYDAAAQRFAVPGSWWPLALMLGLFAIKFIAGTALALQRELAASLPFALATSAAFGVFSGAFLGRAMALWTLARRASLLPAMP
jgi:hypothetical protein